MLSPVTKIDLQRAQKNLLRAVASFEFSKGILVLLIGLSALLLVHKDAWVIAMKSSTNRFALGLAEGIWDNGTVTGETLR